MKDFNDTDLAVGDTVAYLPPNYRHLIRGTVVGFTPKGVVIERYQTEEYIRSYNLRYNTPYHPTIDRRERGYVAKIEVKDEQNSSRNSSSD
jgi:hypothetical protein